MNTNKLLQNIRLGRSPFVIIAVTTLAVIAISIYCLASGFFIVFQNLFYIPIIIACVYYTKRGFVFSVVLVCVYFFLTLGFTRESSILLEASARILVFTLVAGIVTYLSLVRKRAEEVLRWQRDNLEDLVHERTAQLEDDVARRKQAEEALQASEEKFSKAFKTSPYAITITRAEDGGFIEVNDAFTSIAGYTREEALSNSSVGMKLWANEADRESVVANLRAGRVVEGREYQFRTNSGKNITGLFSARIIRLSSGPCILSSIDDITDRKRAEEALHSSEAFLNGVIEQSPESLWVSDSDGTMIRMNPACRELFGITDEEVVGKYNLFKDNLIKEQGFMPLVEAVFKKGKIARFTTDYDLPRVEHIKVSGAMHRIIDVVISPIKDLSGKVTNAIIQHKDVTDRVRAEEEIKRYSLDLMRSNQDLQQFANVASHDLQEPLRMIASYLQLIEQRYKSKLDKDADDFINYAVDGANRMQGLINGLLTFSRVESRSKPFEPMDTETIFKDTLSNLEVAISENRATITHDYLPPIIADASQIGQVFQNLISNAIKFRREEAPRIHVSAKKKEEQWVFSFKDNGIGIDPQYKDKVFVLFQRLGGVRYSGSGVGLTVCKRIVERHGGHIWFESELGRGATFYFTVPIK